MTILSTTLNLFGALLLTHAVYSAHEHASLTTLPLIPTTPPPSHILTPLTPTNLPPLDIVLETLLSVLLITIGIVLASAPLKPIQWRIWAGGLEKEDRRGEVRREGEEGIRGNPYRALEERGGFLDVRGLRRGFAEWVREGGE